MKTFKTTVKEVFEALEKNGFEHLRGSWFTYSGNDDNLVIGGCVLGQAAINLGALQDSTDDDDEEQLSLYNALNNFPSTEGKWNEVGHTSVGDQIIYWNDKTIQEEFGKIVYALPTWEEVVEMARDCLTPYFDETVTLAKYEWNIPKTN